MKYSLLLISIFFISCAYSVSSKSTIKTEKDKTIIVDIPTDLPPPPSAKEVMPTRPFFADSTENELMEKIQDLEERIQKLEKAMVVSGKKGN